MKMAKIFTISEALSIAYHSMMMILTSKERLNANEIADRLKASRHHVSKVLQRLVKDDLLSSNRGPAGGFIIKRDASQITLYDIYRSIEGNIESYECNIDDPICSNKKCMLDSFGQRMTLEFKEYLCSTSLISQL